MGDRKEYVNIAQYKCDIIIYYKRIVNFYEKICKIILKILYKSL